MSVVVVGAGIVGASIAYHLARLDVPVTLIDRAPSPAQGVTGGSFAWIGDRGGDWPGGADDLRQFVRADYRRLEAELPGVAVRWSGSLAWTADARPGPGQSWVGRDEIRALEPHLRNPPDRAVHTPTDGGVDPVRLTRALVRAARTHGAKVLLGSAVTSLRGALPPASTVVLAAGTEVERLAGSMGVRLPVPTSPALLMRVATPPGLVRTIVVNPDFEAREVRDGHLLMTAPTAEVRHTMKRLRATFSATGPFRLRGWRVSERPMPSDGPLLGYVTPDRSVYVAVMHSAVSLAPTAGRLVAAELAGGDPVAELRRCRPPATWAG